MRNLARSFLNKDELGQVEAAVKAAEKQTAGEIACLIQSASYRYPMANVLGATCMALPGALALTPLIGGVFWIGTQNLWLFLGLFGILFLIFHQIVDRIPWIKRRFISRAELEEEVQEAAVTAFFNRGLYRTRDANGILIYISVFECKVWILADQGINAKVAAGQWDTLVAGITNGIRRKRSAEAISEAIAAIGAILKEHFPIKTDDANELQNVIIGE